MKNLILHALLLTGVSAQAQYFHHNYGTANFEEAFSGMVTTQVGAGFVISGVRTTSTDGYIALVRADNQGDITGTSHFQNYYSIYTNNGLSQVMRTRQAFVTELSSTRFAIAGVCYANATLQKMRVFYTLVDQAGFVIPSLITIGGFPYNVRTYDTGNNDYYDVRNVHLAPSGTELYIIGQFANAGDQYSMVLKVDVAQGDLIWSGIYDIGTMGEMATDAVEDPSTGELVVVGYSQDMGNEDGYVLRLDPANGNIITSTQIYGTSGTYDRFYGITLNATGDYLICGATGTSTSHDGWAISLSNGFNVNWSKQYDYSGSGADEYCFDIIERINSSGNPEIYTVGKVAGGYFGNGDMLVYLINGTNGTCLRQLTYGTSLEDFGCKIDQDNNGTAPGFSIYGTSSVTASPSPNRQLSIFKNYFNGVTTCNYYGFLPEENNGPVLDNNLDHSLSGQLYDQWAWLEDMGNLSDQTVCYATSVAGGSNQRLVGDDPSTYSIYPNPGNGVFHLETKNKTGVLKVYDVLGNLVLQKKVSTGILEIELTTYPDGVYMVHITGSEEPQIMKIIKSK